jgi:hypothetical protein
MITCEYALSATNQSREYINGRGCYAFSRILHNIEQILYYKGQWRARLYSVTQQFSTRGT